MVRVRKVLSLQQVALALIVGIASGIYIYRSPLQQYKLDSASDTGSKDQEHALNESDTSIERTGDTESSNSRDS